VQVIKDATGRKEADEMPSCAALTHSAEVEARGFQGREEDD
jgi:hypothetical protein